MPAYWFGPDGNILPEYIDDAQLEETTYIGLCTFYFGTNDHTPNAQLGALMLEEGAIATIDLNVPYRNQCWAYFHDNYIGDYNRAPTMKIVLKKSPECSFDTGEVTTTTA
jgi:hypothetical protein